MMRVVMPYYGTVEILPDGSYQLQHAYELPADKNQFVVIVQVRAVNEDNDDDVRTQLLTVIPRFQVWHADVQFQLLEKGDSLAESTSEWSLSQSSRVSQSPVQSTEPFGSTRRWAFDIGESILPSLWKKLENSGRSHDLVNGGFWYDSFSMNEIDPVWDDHYSCTLKLDVNIEGGLIEIVDSSGTIKLKFYQDVKLIKPINDGRPPVVAHS